MAPRQGPQLFGAGAGEQGERDVGAIAADPGHADELDRDLLNLLTEWNHADPPGRTAYDAEYLLFTARRR